jgi:hypothetical protein
MSSLAGRGANLILLGEATYGFAIPLGRSPHSIKVKNPKAPAVRREAEEEWGR